MPDDIVTKLEFLLQEGAAIIKDQSDEIERLRAELVQANNQIKLLIAIETAPQDDKEAANG